jgi:hypothetical protein
MLDALGRGGRRLHAQEYFTHAHKPTHASTPHDDTPQESFTRIITGLTDIHESHHTGDRASTNVLITEAAQLQDRTAQSALNYMGGLDTSKVWNLWRKPLSPDNVMGDMHITTEPVLSLTTTR